MVQTFLPVGLAEKVGFECCTKSLAPAAESSAVFLSVSRDEPPEGA
jgi:hypothetical protein